MKLHQDSNSDDIKKKTLVQEENIIIENELINNIISLFSLIAKPFKDKEGGEKQVEIQNWLNQKGIRNEYIPGIGKIVNQLENPRIILVSHMDLIRKFQKGFAEGETHILQRTKKGNIHIKGALDNTITNAVALLALEYLLQQGIEDVELVLTEGEEVGMKGMDAYIKAYKDKAKNAFFINLDVTNEGWKLHSSVEYDKPSFHMLKQVQKHLKEHKAFYTGNRVCDDTDAVNDNGCFGFSFCLPTKDLIHSYENKACVYSLEGYFNGLVSLLINLELHENMNKTFSRFHFSKALEMESFEEFSEFLKKEEESRARTSYSTNYSKGKGNKPRRIFVDYDKEDFVSSKKKPKGPPSGEELQFRGELVDAICDWIFKSRNITDKNLKAELGGFIEMQIMNDESFFISDLALVFKKEKFPIKKASEIIDELIDFGSIEEIDTDQYQFVLTDF